VGVLDLGLAQGCDQLAKLSDELLHPGLQLRDFLLIARIRGAAARERRLTRPDADVRRRRAFLQGVPLLLRRRELLLELLVLLLQRGALGAQLLQLRYDLRADAAATAAARLLRARNVGCQRDETCQGGEREDRLVRNQLSHESAHYNYCELRRT